jgi:ferrous iron transport protein A
VSSQPIEINVLTPVVALAGEASGAPDAAARPLTDLPLRTPARIVALVPPAGLHDPEIVARLGELGFLPGERVRVLARGLFGDPLAVRVGTGTFALRGGEAACVRVRVEAPDGAS